MLSLSKVYSLNLIYKNKRKIISFFYLLEQILVIHLQPLFMVDLFLPGKGNKSFQKIA